MAIVIVFAAQMCMICISNHVIMHQNFKNEIGMINLYWLVSQVNMQLPVRSVVKEACCCLGSYIVLYSSYAT